MMRSLYSGVSGLRNHQTRMDVIGNNIANVNTVGFKRNRVSFQDMLYQNIRGASASGAGVGAGGTNPAQVGLGVTVGSIDTIHTQGSSQTTGKMSDLMLQGDGFFILSDGAAVPNYYYTRAGNFEFDEQGFLVNPANGYYVMQDDGVTPIQRPAGANSYKIDSTGTITWDTGATDIIGATTFSNPSGLEKVGENLYIETLNSGAPNASQVGDALVGLGNTKIIPGSLEMSNVDLSQEFTDMIVTQRGFQANSRIITVSDSMLEELVNLKR